MSVLLTHLLARAARGQATGSDQRILAYLADPSVNRRVFGLPLPATSGYYWRELLCLVTASERFSAAPPGGTSSG